MDRPIPTQAGRVGEHVASVLLTARPSALDELIEFAGRIGAAESFDRDVRAVMSALAVDAEAARSRLDDGLMETVAPEPGDGLEVDPTKLRTLVVEALGALHDDELTTVVDLVEEYGVVVMVDPDHRDRRIVRIRTIEEDILRCRYAAIAPDVPGTGRHHGVAHGPAR